MRCEAALIVCTHVAARQCVICGRFYCAQHGNVAAGYCRHCRVPFARRQIADHAAAAEADRQAAAAARNSVGVCGWDGCDEGATVLCQHCGLLYCGRHTTHYRYRYRYRTRRGIEVRRAEIVLCDACKTALPEYKREKTWLEV